MARRAHGAMVGWHPCVRRTRGARAMPASGRLEPPQHRGATMATIEKPATYEPPGRPGSLVEVKDRYENFIGGAWTPPDHRRVPREPEPGDGRAVLRDRLLDSRGHRARARRRARRQGRMGGKTSAAERAAVLDAIADAMRGQPRDARDRRELGERQAGARDARRRPAAGDRPLPLLRRRDPRRGGPDLRDRRADRTRTTSASRWASSGRSSRSTSRC